MSQRVDQSTAEGSLFTDQYQLTMAQLYFRLGMHERMTQFDYFFRSYPDYGNHQAGYCINAGLAWLLDWMRKTRFRAQDLDYLRGQRGRTGKPIFREDFLAWLGQNGHFNRLTLRAVPEGRVVHANVPLTVVQGPLAMAQILETSLLNHLNYPTLIATKASRIRLAGRGRPLLEFGLRRGPEKGANAGARAALIGGADYTSNAGISHVLGYQPQGTHAHSLVQVFLTLGESELDAFRAYADIYPDDCLLLVDTVNTLESGVPNAIKVFEELRRKGHRPVGIRLDSGDLAYLSIQAVKMLAGAGFADTSIVFSNQLDELVLLQILTQIEQEAPNYGIEPDAVIDRLVFGVGTSLITSQGQAALDGVYKLVAVRIDSEWAPAIKLSENPIKVPNPGNKKVWRIYDERGKAVADLLGLQKEDPGRMETITLRHPIEPSSFRQLERASVSKIESLLVDVIVDGQVVYESPSIEQMRARRDDDLERLDPGIKRIINPHIYHVSLTNELWDLKQHLMASL